MNLSSLKTEQLEAYLSSLTPAAARFLIREVELDRLRGGESFPHDLILTYARNVLVDQEDQVERVGSPLRLFCRPFEDLLVDKTTADKQIGRIDRQSIEPIWNWLSNELAVEQIGELDEILSRALIDEDQSSVSRCTRELHVLCHHALAEQIAPLEVGSVEYMRLAARLGGDRVLEDARDVAFVLERAETALTFIERLPQHQDSVSAQDAKRFAKLYADARNEAPDHAYLLLLILSSRLRRAADILKIVTEIVGSDRDDAVRATELSVVGDCLLHDMEVAAHGALQAIAGRAPIDLVERFLGHYFEIAEGFMSHVDVDMRAGWGWRVIAIRNALSASLKSALEAAPRLIKLALYRKGRNTGGDAATLEWPDGRAIEDADFVVRLMLCVQPLLSQIPINADYANVRSNVCSFIESIAEISLDDVRRCSGEESRCAEAYLKAIANFTELVFGIDTAEMLRRRGRVAMQSEGDAAEAG